MPIKTHAKVTVVADEINVSHGGFHRTYTAGDTDVEIPANIAKELADQGAVTITTPADAS
ncbi:hypothetical protein [Sulfitobacter sp. 1A15106]|uniref:hypothetical protein n=1 Tax=Sulfitobacter sp. 1A15106 TaxID=3368590 RepID=UPI0037453170